MHQQQQELDESLLDVEMTDGSEPLALSDLASPSPQPKTSLRRGKPKASPLRRAQPQAPPSPAPAPNPPLFSLDFRRDAFELTEQALAPTAVADEFSSGVSASLCGSASLSPSGLLCGSLTDDGEGHAKLAPFALGGPQGFAVEVLIRSDFDENSVIFDFKVRSGEERSNGVEKTCLRDVYIFLRNFRALSRCC